MPSNYNVILGGGEEQTKEAFDVASNILHFVKMFYWNLYWCKSCSTEGMLYFRRSEKNHCYTHAWASRAYLDISS